ncbi:cyclase family protein [Aureimonas jatrophae]|uniref:Kynurenine formamidase n=1 Tax=Aureimonas jatrophae TaxID=1166073 RepID=A0A1H0KTS0_9HYPH|nr:cyclase family protein [Aureimonas jatrophae]MBB3948870.1 kynurenine formamidase [Aureimonas jatrophae]SDO59329.1 Kynurenine formamidase [Aureimonas jatrophae]
MCPPGCLHSICAQATRRGVLRSGFALGAAMALPSASLAAPVPAAEHRFSTVHDLTHTLFEGFPTFSGERWFTVEKPVTWDKDKVNLHRWTLMEHTGTHMDAPLHFSQDGLSVDLIPIADLVVPLAVIDIRERAAANPDTSLTPDDIARWEARYGRLPDGCCVAMNSGWHALLDEPRFTGRDADGRNHTPGFHIEAADFLLRERDVKGIAVDTLSLDTGLASSGAFPVHYAWLGSGRWGVEAIAGLDDLPASGAMLVVAGPKVRGGTGGPSRVLALV